VCVCIINEILLLMILINESSIINENDININDNSIINEILILILMK